MFGFAAKQRVWEHMSTPLYYGSLAAFLSFPSTRVAETLQAINFAQRKIYALSVGIMSASSK